MRGGRYRRRSLVVLLRSVRHDENTADDHASVVAQGLLLGGCNSSSSSNVTADAGSAGSMRPARGAASIAARGHDHEPGRDHVRHVRRDQPGDDRGLDRGSDFTVISFDPLPGVSDRSLQFRRRPLLHTDHADRDHRGRRRSDSHRARQFRRLLQAHHRRLPPLVRLPGELPRRRIDLTAPCAMLAPSDAIDLAGRSARTWTSTPARAWGSCSSRSTIASKWQAAGVQFAMSVNAGATTVPLLYLADGLPSGTATETARSARRVSSTAPVGTMTITATLAATNQTLGTITVNIRAGGSRRPAGYACGVTR